MLHFKFNITLNPKKCYFGLTEVEFVGHVLKNYGVRFSTEKRSKVLDFALPVKQKQLKSFLGLVNYFRDHVKDFSNKVKPLNDIMALIRRARQLTGHPGRRSASGTFRSQWVNAPSSST